MNSDHLMTLPKASAVMTKDRLSSGRPSGSSKTATRADGEALLSAQRAAPRGRSFADELRGPDDSGSAAKPAAQDAASSSSSPSVKQNNAESKTLSPLRQVASQQRGSIENNQLLSVLTGRFEGVDPASIPKLLSGNEFVTEALAESDINAFLARPMPLAELLQDLGLPASLMDEAQKLGLDTNQLVSAFDLLKALGIDAKRFSIELNLMKENLPHDGFAPYMIRAALVQNGTPSQKDSVPPVLGESLQESPLDGAKQGELLQQSGLVFQANRGLLGLERMPTGEAQGQPLIMSEAKGLVDGGSGPHNGRLGVQGPQLPTRLMGMPEGMAGLTSGLSPSMLPQLNGSMDQMVLAQSLPGENAAGLTQPIFDENTPVISVLQPSSRPRMHEATFDAFATLGERLKMADGINIHQNGELRTQPAELLVVDPQGATLTSEEAALLTMPAKPQALSHLTPVMKQPIEIERLLVGQMTLRPEEAPVLLVEASDADPLILAQHSSFAGPNLAGWSSISMAEKPFINRSINMQESLPLEELRFEAASLHTSEPRSSADREMDGRSDEQQNHSFAESSKFEASFKSLESPSRIAAPGVFTQTILEKVSDPGMSTVERAQVVQQIFDRATMAAREGGGIVRLDLGSAGLGNLEMAINLDQDRLDLKILTASERVRELMASELHKLRDALVVQNVQLGQVEVGVNQQRPAPGQESFVNGQFSSNHGGRSFSGSHDRHERAQTGVAAAGGLRLRRADGTNNTAAPVAWVRASNSNANGRLAIRA